MSEYKVLTDGNGSDLIHVVGMGDYVPLPKLRALQHEVETTQSALKRVSDYAGRLENDKNELAATVEALRDAAQAFSFSFAHDEEVKDATESTLCRFADLQAAIVATPQQHLRDVEARAGRAGFIAGFELKDKQPRYVSYGKAANKYADNIRQEGLND